MATVNTKVIDAQGKALSRGSSKGVAFVNFEADKFSYLNITSIVSYPVKDDSECGFACLEIPSCVSYNLAAYPDVNGKLLCELLPSNKYNNSDKISASQVFHHFSITVRVLLNKLTSVFYAYVMLIA